MYPDVNGYYADFGGRFVPETLIPALNNLEQAYQEACNDAEFNKELQYYLSTYVGRESPLYYARRLSAETGCRIYLKREDLNHTGSHKINNTMGQALLAKRMGKVRLVAETGAGQHGVATATAAAVLGMKCTVYMGAIDAMRQKLNVFRMKMLGAEVIEVAKGSQTLKDATNQAFRDYIENFDSTHMVIGSVVGPHPYPMIVRDFQSIIGKELMQQFQQIEGKGGLPEYILACVGGGSNSMGVFYPFLPTSVKLVGVEAGGKGLGAGEHCATLSYGTPGVLHGAFSKLLQDDAGQISPTHSISAGLDYPGVGPEHAFLQQQQRVDYVHINDREALQAFLKLSEYEGIIPAFESAHAVAYALKMAPSLRSNESIVINLSGRGDKDVEEAARYLGGGEI